MFRFVLMSALVFGALAPFAPAVDAAPPVSTPLVPAVAGANTQHFVAAPANAARRNYFLGLHRFTDWTYASVAHSSEGTFTSPPLTVPLEWNEMVPSWNATLPPDATLTIEARAIYAARDAKPEHTTKYYVMGHWSGDPVKHPRGSVKKQGDSDGTVDTDTLLLTRRGARLQIRLTLGRGTDAQAAAQSAPAGSASGLVDSIRFMGFSFLDSTLKALPLESDATVWGTTLPVPERFQLDHEAQGGAVWCSPTSVSMILAHRANITKRPELNMTIPQVQSAVLDPVWPGAGNWSFNTSFAGSLPGVRGYVARLDGLNEVESWIGAGIPLALSVDYGLLKGKPDKTGGHLVVCVGFTKTGDAVIADPYLYTEPGQPYHVFPRHNVVAGWGASHNTVYLIYPETMATPANTAHHWDG